jgi:hypothetical protein
MKWTIHVSLLICVAAEAADPPRSVVFPAAERANESTKAIAAARKPLDLRIGNIRDYMTPEEYRSLLAGREEERNTVVVRAEAPQLPSNSEQPIPSGMPLLPLWWAVLHPTQSWRIFLPDLNAPPPGPPEKIPPPVFRWGP